MTDGTGRINRGTLRAMKKWLWDGAAGAIIAIAVISFFWRFFFPTPQLLVTPDFGRSDAWHFSYPTKYLLHESLKANTLPVWSLALGTGFPILAEGQTGTFFLPNLVLFRLFDPVTAFNLSLVAAALTIGWGMYLFLRTLTCSRLASLFGGITIAFSGLVATELPHITLIQGFSLLPWIMTTTYKLAEKKSFLWISILAILISQQIFSGFPQASFITLLFAGSYYVWHVRLRLSDIARFAVAVFFAIGLSAIQVLPSMEFLRESSARSGFSPRDAAYFSYPLKHLVTFLDPYRLGNPKLGTYPAFSAFDGSIFWENTGFIGIVPLLFVLLFIFSLKRPRLKGVTLFFLVSLFLSFLLMLGSHSPFYIIYSFWPFNLFRVPSRFLWTSVFCLIVFAAKGMDSLARRGLTRVALVVIVLLHTLFLIKTWGGYQATQPANEWLRAPEVVKLLSPDRIFTVGSETTHNQTFLTKGWQDMTPYVELRNSLAPDSNVLWGVSSMQVYAGRFLRRQSLVDSLLRTAIDVDAKGATVSGRMQKVLNLFSVNQLVSTVPLESDGSFVSRGAATQGNLTVSVYKNPHALGRTYLARRAVVAQTFEDAVRKIAEDSFIPGQSVVVEKPLELTGSEGGGEAEITHEADTSVTIAVRANPNASLLILADTYYPGWRAFVDGGEVSIIPVNINQRAVVVDPGNHTVRFFYDPQSLRFGTLISSATLFVIAAGFLLTFVNAHIHQKVYGRRRHSSYSRAGSRLRKG